MSEEQKSRLFRPFTQADYSTTRKFGGTGLGLTISKTLVNLMGGEISVSSVPGLGSCFEFSLPTGSLENVEIIADPSEVNLEEIVNESVGAEVASNVAANVLLAEDGVDNRRLISFHLKKAGCQVTTAENGKLAFDEATAAEKRGESFDIIFMDMQMPVMDGYQAASKLRDAGYRGPICALTAHAMNGDREKCINAGCDDYLTKPINVDKLISAARKSRNVVSKIAITDGPAGVSRKSVTLETPVPKAEVAVNPEPAAAQPVAPAVELETPTSVEPNTEVAAAEDSVNFIQELPPSAISQEPVVSQSSNTNSSEGIEPLISDFADDPDMLEIIEMFVDGLSERIDSILTAFEDRNFTSVSGIAHQLKGASGGYGYPSLSELAFEVEQLAKRNAEDDQIEAALTVLVAECRRAIVGVRGSIANDPVVDSVNSSVAAGFEGAAAVTESVQNVEQSATLETIHEQVSEVVQPAQPQVAVGNPLGAIAAQIESLNDPNVDSQQLSAALMSLAQVLGNTTNSNTQVADNVS